MPIARKITVSPEWINLAESRMKTRKVDCCTLAGKVGLSSTTITNVFKEEKASPNTIEKMNEYLGIDEYLEEKMRCSKRLRDEAKKQYGTIYQFADALHENYSTIKHLFYEKPNYNQMNSKWAKRISKFLEVDLTNEFPNFLKEEPEQMEMNFADDNNEQLDLLETLKSIQKSLHEIKGLFEGDYIRKVICYELQKVFAMNAEMFDKEFFSEEGEE